eukprot:gene3263-3744_t
MPKKSAEMEINWSRRYGSHHHLVRPNNNQFGRVSGLNIVWVARYRFAVLDEQQKVEEERRWVEELYPTSVREVWVKLYW